jgi:hypothetical protein
MNVITVGGISYLPEAKAIIAMKDSADYFSDDPEQIVLRIENYEIIPWGDDNLMPKTVVDNIGKSEVIGANLEFNVLVGYGRGIKPMRRIIENKKVVGYEEIYDDQKVLDFCMNNDINGYFLEQMMDLKTFYNVFPEIIISKDKTQIVQIRSKEAMFSRWGKMDAKLNRITKHYYSAQWPWNPGKTNIDVTDVLDRYSPLLDLQDRLKNGKYSNLRFIIPISFPSPGRPYYQLAPWWSLFTSGWYDFSLMVPAAKKALMKNRFAVKYIIYLSPKYFKQLFKDEGIDPSDEQATKARIDQEHQRFGEFLTGSENAGRGIVALKDMVQSNMGAKEEKYIEIETIDLGREGGEFIDDSEEVSNIISYVMGVHSSLIGNTPGKSKGSFSGTDKRELFMMKQAMMKPFRDRLLRPLEIVSKFNKWDPNIVWAVPDIEFTTLDQNKTGQQTTITE